MEPSAEVIEAVAEAISAVDEVPAHDWFERLARAALNAAGAAVERDSVVGPAKDSTFGNTITERAALVYLLKESARIVQEGIDEWAGEDANLDAIEVFGALHEAIARYESGAVKLPTETIEREPIMESRSNGAPPKGLDEAFNEYLASGKPKGFDYPWIEAFSAGFEAGAAWREAQGAKGME